MLSRRDQVQSHQLPDALPDAKRMLGGPWTLCSQQARDTAGGLIATTVLTVGRCPSGGRDRVTPRCSPGTPTPIGSTWVARHRYEITSEKIVLEGLAVSAPN